MRGISYFLLSTLIQVSTSAFQVIGVIGHNVTLPCGYDVQAHGVLSFCWGRGEVPRSKCSDTVLSSPDGSVAERQASRYQLLGRPTLGDVSLTILDAQVTDAGVYGCRVEVPGWFNDHKVNTHLVMEEAPQPVTQNGRLSAEATTEILLTPAPEIVDIGDHTLVKIQSLKTEEKSKAFLTVGNIVRAAAIFSCTVIIILVFILRRMFLLRGTLQHVNTSTAENIYESLPMFD